MIAIESGSQAGWGGVPNQHRLLIGCIDPNTIIPGHKTNAVAGLGTSIPMDLCWKANSRYHRESSVKRAINKTWPHHHGVVTKPTPYSSQLESKVNLCSQRKSNKFRKGLSCNFCLMQICNSVLQRLRENVQMLRSTCL